MTKAYRMNVRIAAPLLALGVLAGYGPAGAQTRATVASPNPATAPATLTPPAPALGSDWAGGDPLPFREIVIGDVKLSSCEFDFQHSASLKRYNAQMNCEASSAPKMRVDRIVTVEFVVRHTRPDQPWFSLVSAELNLPASGQATQLVSNATGYYDASLADPDPNLNQIQVRATVKSAVTTTPTALVPQYPSASQAVGAAPLR